MLVEFKEVSKSYRYDFWTPQFFALEKASFSISRGQVVGFLGANGAGKTTSIKILMDFIRPDDGEVIFSSELGKNRRERMNNIGFLPERPYFYPTLTGEEFCFYMGRLNGLSTAAIRQNINKWAEIFNISFALNRKIQTYSKGMLQRLGFVTALLHNPHLIVLDEPLSGLDPLGRKEIKDALLLLHREGKTIFFSSHIVSDVEEICSQVVVLQKGKMLYQGSIDKLIEDNLSDEFTLICSSSTLPEIFLQYPHYQREDGLWNICCPYHAKAVALSAAVEKKIEIYSLRPNRPSLEQIIYQVGGDQHG